jgi:hypothetical protein
MTFKAKIYIAGPYSKGDPEVNTIKAITIANKLADLGYAPFVPHFTHYWHVKYPRPYQFWLDLDNQFIPCCDAILRIPGESSGADNEIKYAIKLGKLIFYSIKDLDLFYGKK